MFLFPFPSPFPLQCLLPLFPFTPACYLVAATGALGHGICNHFNARDRRSRCGDTFAALSAASLRRIAFRVPCYPSVGRWWRATRHRGWWPEHRVGEFAFGVTAAIVVSRDSGLSNGQQLDHAAHLIASEELGTDALHDCLGVSAQVWTSSSAEGGPSRHTVNVGSRARPLTDDPPIAMDDHHDGYRSLRERDDHDSRLRVGANDNDIHLPGMQCGRHRRSPSAEADRATALRRMQPMAR